MCCSPGACGIPPSLPFVEITPFFAYLVFSNGMAMLLSGHGGGTAETPVLEEIQDDEVRTQEPAKVILFNDNIHTFDEVISQLIKATGCSSARAEALAWEVHTQGKAVVYDGPMDRCLKVSGVLEEIGLHTTIEV